MFALLLLMLMMMLRKLPWQIVSVKIDKYLHTIFIATFPQPLLSRRLCDCARGYPPRVPSKLISFFNFPNGLHHKNLNILEI